MQRWLCSWGSAHCVCGVPRGSFRELGAPAASPGPACWAQKRPLKSPTPGRRIGCDPATCSIPSGAFDGDKPDLGLIEHCRLSGLPDLNQTEPFVRSQVRGRQGWGERRSRPF